MASWHVARSLNVLRDEINASAPKRSKASDGSIGDAAHSARLSDHNPCSCHGAVCARDLTHDPAGGFDSYKFADWLRSRCQSGVEKRVKYIISNRRIASGTIGNWNWRSYSGANPHSKHCHVSVSHGPSAFDNPKSWGWKAAPPVTPPVKPPPTQAWYSKLMTNQPTLRKGAKGIDVKRMQHLIAATGHMDPANTGNYDGVFGTGTETALNNFKASIGGRRDGTCDPWTWGALMHTVDGIPTIKRGAKGADVERMQHLLAAMSYLDEANTANYDGVWGNGTEAAEQRFDQAHHTGPPTDCGAKSWTSLLDGIVWK